MTELVWGSLAVVFGLFVLWRGRVSYRNAEQESERLRTGPAARLQPRWAVRRWTPGQVRANAATTFIGGPAFVVFGVLLITGVIHLG